MLDGATRTTGRYDDRVRTIRQQVTVRASPREVYETLLDSRRHARLTGAAARISRKVGGSFSAYDGSLSGRNLALAPGRKIVQTWRGADWPEGHHSTARFTFERAPSGTRLTLRQTGVPADLYEDYRQGWHDYYWKPLRALFGP